MKQLLKRFLKRNNKLYKAAEIINFIFSAKYSKIDGGIKKYPKVIQLPITGRCNSKCVMCNVWKMDVTNEVILDEFAEFLKDPIFREVEGVGINGGEPSLLKDLDLYAEEVLKLPKLKSLNVISNGFSKKILTEKLEKIYSNCRKNNVFFSLSISLDGVNDVHNKVRGIPNVFSRVVETIDDIVKNKTKYCDDLELGCTVVNQNVDYLVELDTFAKLKGYKIKYRLGIYNERIENRNIIKDFSVLNNFNKQTAKEFFFNRINKSKHLHEKFKYFSIYYYLNSKKPRRLLGCSWKDEGVTLDYKGNLYYCAVESCKIGSLREKSGEEIFFDRKNIEYRKTIISNKCNDCIHDYTGKPYIKDVMEFVKYIFHEKFWCSIYKLKGLL